MSHLYDRIVKVGTFWPKLVLSCRRQWTWRECGGHKEGSWRTCSTSRRLPWRRTWCCSPLCGRRREPGGTWSYWTRRRKPRQTTCWTCPHFSSTWSWTSRCTRRPGREQHGRWAGRGKFPQVTMVDRWPLPSSRRVLQLVNGVIRLTHYHEVVVEPCPTAHYHVASQGHCLSFKYTWVRSSFEFCLPLPHGFINLRQDSSANFEIFSSHEFSYFWQLPQ